MATAAEILAQGETPPSSAAMKRLAAARVQRLDGDWIELGSLWEDRPAALIFLRHYG